MSKENKYNVNVQPAVDHQIILRNQLAIMEALKGISYNFECASNLERRVVETKKELGEE